MCQRLTLPISAPHNGSTLLRRQKLNSITLSGRRPFLENARVRKMVCWFDGSFCDLFDDSFGDLFDGSFAVLFDGATSESFISSFNNSFYDSFVHEFIR